jgi:hypothetical protein
VEGAVRYVQLRPAPSTQRPMIDESASARGHGADPPDHEGSAGRRIPTAHQESSELQALGQTSAETQTLIARLAPQPIDQPQYRSILPNNGSCGLHAVALVEVARCCVVLAHGAHGKVEVAARGFHDFLDELFKYATPRAVELIGVENLVKHDRASGHLNIAHGSSGIALKMATRLPRYSATEGSLPSSQELVP